MSINIYVFFLIINYSFQMECNQSTPIKKQDNNCYLVYCTDLEFDQGICSINNTIIKIQWINNPINASNT